MLCILLHFGVAKYILNGIIALDVECLVRFFCVEEVYGMSDLIELKLVTEDEAE